MNVLYYVPVLVEQWVIVEVVAVVMAAAVAVVVSAAVDVPVGLLTDGPTNWNVQKQLIELLIVCIVLDIKQNKLQE